MVLSSRRKGGKVQARKLAVKLSGSIIKRNRRIDSGVESAEPVLHTFFLDARSPSTSFCLVNPSEPRRGALPNPIGAILRWRADPQVGANIVEAIAIDMIDLHPAVRTKKKAVEIDVGRIYSRSHIRADTCPVPVGNHGNRPPLIGPHGLGVAFINDSGSSTGERKQYGNHAAWS